MQYDNPDPENPDQLQAMSNNTGPEDLSGERPYDAKIEAVIREAEDRRLAYMRRYKGRTNFSLTLSLLAVFFGGGGFGWFFLMEGDFIRALACLVLACIVPLFTHIWAQRVLDAYRTDYKKSFMPKMAKAIGGLKFYENRGVQSSVLPKTAIVPSYKNYSAEDCFAGKYKGAKIILSEATLKDKEEHPVFRGLFVFLEVPQKIFEGHTIISADRHQIARYEHTRWQSLSPLPYATGNPNWDRFTIFTDNPDNAQSFINEKLVKELAEAADIFNKAPISAAFFKGRYIFLMIPNNQNMFEASHIYEPIATRKQARQCREEVKRILEIVDVLDVYRANKTQAAVKPS